MAALLDFDWMARFAVLADLAKAFLCADRIKTGQEFVFNFGGRLDATNSTALLCLGIPTKLKPAIMLSQGHTPGAAGSDQLDFSRILNVSTPVSTMAKPAKSMSTYTSSATAAAVRGSNDARTPDNKALQ
jgi:hypothetical protein